MKNWSNPEIKNLGLELTENGDGYVKNKETGQEIHSDPSRTRMLIPIFGKWIWYSELDGVWSTKFYDTPCEAWAALKEHIDAICTQAS